MKGSWKSVFAGLSLLGLTASAYYSMSWKIQEGYAVQFESAHASGYFEELAGEISFDPMDLANSKFDASVAVASIHTGIGLKDKHARGENWFDAERYPRIRFVSEAFTRKAEGFVAQGSLEMHGQKMPMALPFQFDGARFKSEFQVNRLDFGVGTMEGMSAKVDSILHVVLDVPVIQ